jgi:hypothetical protein
MRDCRAEYPAPWFTKAKFQPEGKPGHDKKINYFGVDAALDEANSKKYGDMIAELSKYSQLILVTHNRETMSRAGIIYGVTMGMDGVSKLLSIQFEEAVQVAK